MHIVKTILGRLVFAACLSLVAVNILTLAGRHYWLFDVLSSFRLQYLLAALILFFICLALNKTKTGLLMVALALLLAIGIRMPLSQPFAIAAPAGTAPNFTIVHYNKHFGNNDLDSIGSWLGENSANTDIVFIQESLTRTIWDYRQYKNIFPHQYPNTKEEKKNDIGILSKHPFSVKTLEIQTSDGPFYAYRITIEKAGLKPLTVYTYHARSPITATYYKRQREELDALSMAIAADPSSNIIFTGDWNITPYSPYFEDIQKSKNLKYQYYGLFPMTTWPSYAKADLLKIQIDHMLYSGTLQLSELKRGPSLGSDHHALIARFLIPSKQ